MEDLVLGGTVEAAKFVNGGVTFCGVVINIVVIEREADDVKKSVKEGGWRRGFEWGVFGYLEEKIERQSCSGEMEDVDIVDRGRDAEIRVWRQEIISRQLQAGYCCHSWAERTSYGSQREDVG